MAAKIDTSFELVFLTAAGQLERWTAWHSMNNGSSRFEHGMGMPVWEAVILETFVDLMASRPDSLIIRKCGRELSEEASHRASLVMERGCCTNPEGRAALREFDTWLRSDGHRLNPGSSADLMAASLFVALREHPVQFPHLAEISRHAAEVRRHAAS